MTIRSPGARAKPPRDERRRSGAGDCAQGCRRSARRFGSKPLEGLRGPAFDIETEFQTVGVRAGGPTGDRGDRLARWVSGSDFAAGQFWRTCGRIEAAPHLSVSRDKFGCGPRFFDFEVAVHVGFLAFERRSGLFGPVIGFAPALPGNREAVVPQGRAERAGASRQPLAARPALAVAILFSFPHR
jgi:hypothetical protein